MEDDLDFLGKGWSFPPTFDKDSASVKMSSGLIDIQESLWILLSTRLGERVMQPKYGCQLDELQFENLNRTTITYISELIRTAILYHEPRIEVEKIEILEEEMVSGKVLIKLNYLVRSTNSRMNMVYPYYLNEGTSI
ncbi:GPW/gp25 family protein [Cyclobacterium marinum]|uniref:GPW/gp25 family protein n=1 Tax=Cyclobacterium marinum (strain ATCC 25205 / DSM 745 / LMG 13164 / NCIMB 1802) TaxID=880070 RepID=G0J5J8_CYCMS|nr:GPW/gp25 family protein [Cyclobacterium marinum]AEL28447.1 GPW/gp25 family protein [Cyclobacterium marinum DSM 745]MBI0398297.1 GPW/gp25 family protein [Cyclobacterium marinum]